MRWPFRRRGSDERLVVSWSRQTFSYVLARSQADGMFEVIRFGVERQGADSQDDFIRRLQALNLKGMDACVMLRPEQYQVFQIDAPAVAPEELRAAARYQIKEMLESHVDDVTLDVMRVGDGLQKGAGHLFVVTATNVVLRNVLDFGISMDWPISVIDIQETAQRNIQNAFSARENRVGRASAALVLIEAQQAVLTISANGELYYTRRFELPDGFLNAMWLSNNQESADAFTPVDEYVPDYSVGGVSYGNDYSHTRLAQPSPMTGNSVDDDKAQRVLVEVQRSLDVWDRSWSSMPLGELCVYAGERSEELSTWLGAQLGQSVVPMNVNALFPGFQGREQSDIDRAMCLPLLGVLMRTESRKL